MPQSAGEGLKSPGKRKFLEAAVAGVLAVSGIKPEDAEAASRREKEKRVEEVKNENTILEFEKKLLEKLNNDEDIKGINDVDTTLSEETVRSKYRERFRKVVTAVTATLVLGIASAYGFDRFNQHLKKQKDEDADFSKTALTTILGTVVAGGILYNQPKIEHVGAAEQSLIGWVIQEKQAGRIISIESITERIKELTELQKANSASASGKNNK